MTDREAQLRIYLAIWNGEVSLDHLDSLVTKDYVGHLGSSDRDLTGLKDDLEAYRQRASGVRFTVEHRFGEGDYVAPRVTARAKSEAGIALKAAGLNISRWAWPLLAESGPYGNRSTTNEPLTGRQTLESRCPKPGAVQIDRISRELGCGA